MRLRSPRLNGDRAGTGDFFAALLVARLATGSGILSAAMHAVGATTAILERSMLTGTDELPVAEGFIDLLSPPFRFEPADRTSVGAGTSESGRVDHGGRRFITK